MRGGFGRRGVVIFYAVTVRRAEEGKERMGKEEGRESEGEVV